MRNPVIAACVFIVWQVVACESSRPMGRDESQGTSTPATPQSLRAAVDPMRRSRDVAFIARERTPGGPHWQAVQDLCAERLAEWGYEVERMRGEADEIGPYVNVIGRREGKRPDELIVSAHYDHIPGCAGADDNATGVAAVLEAARLLSSLPLEQTLVVACWDQEEPGFGGSGAYAERARMRGVPISAAYVLDGVGYTDRASGSQTLPDGFELLFPDFFEALAARGFVGDFIALIGDTSSRSYHDSLRTHAEAIGLPLSTIEVPNDQTSNPLLSDLRRSDHSSFWDAGYPALFLTDSGDFRNPNYHCMEGADEPDTLDYPFLAQVTRTLVGSAAEMLVTSR